MLAFTGASTNILPLTNEEIPKFCNTPSPTKSGFLGAMIRSFFILLSLLIFSLALQINLPVRPRFAHTVVDILSTEGGFDLMAQRIRLSS